MIVVGSHGPRSSLLGSVSADVSRRAPCPVVVVPPGADDRLNDERRLPSGGNATSTPTSESATQAASSASDSPPIGRRSRHTPRSRGEDMSYDALMRWEWEGGTPASVSERSEATPAEPVEKCAHSATADERASAGAVELRPSRAYRRKVGKAMAANADRRFSCSCSCGVARRRPRRSSIGDGARARAAAVGVDRIRGPLADRLRSRSGGDTGCATPPCLSARAGRGRRPGAPTARRSRCDLQPIGAFRSDLRARPGRRRRSPCRACPRLPSTLPDRQRVAGATASRRQPRTHFEPAA